MLETLLVANVLHGLVASVWLFGLRRFVGPQPSGVWRGLLGAALALPVLLVVLRVLGAPQPDADTAILRVQLWVDALGQSQLVFRALLLVLLGGTTTMFVLQELIPVVRRRNDLLHEPRTVDARLEASLERVLTAFARKDLGARRGHRPAIQCIETGRKSAMLAGLVYPSVLVTRGLMEALDDQQLDGVVAHEVAHLATGGNLDTAGLWLTRALQAPSPGALVLFRTLLEAREAHCDAIAARATGMPGALASALLVICPDSKPLTGGAGTTWARANEELSRRAGRASTRNRIRRLLALADAEEPLRTSWIMIGMLATVLWAVS